MSTRAQKQKIQTRLLKLGMRLAAVEDPDSDARDVARDIGTTVDFVKRWRQSVKDSRNSIRGLRDAPRTGRPRLPVEADPGTYEGIDTGPVGDSPVFPLLTQEHVPEHVPDLECAPFEEIVEGEA